METDIEQYFNKEILSDLAELIRVGDNEYIQYLLNLTSDNIQPDIKLLFKYGVSKLPKLENHEVNLDLGTYFLILSEIRNLPKELSDFALDLMTYCQNGVDYSNMWTNSKFTEEGWDAKIHLNDLFSKV